MRGLVLKKRHKVSRKWHIFDHQLPIVLGLVEIYQAKKLSTHFTATLDTTIRNLDSKQRKSYLTTLKGKLASITVLLENIVMGRAILRCWKGVHVLEAFRRKFFLKGA